MSTVAPAPVEGVVVSKRPKDTPWRQQRMKSWQPIMTPKWVIGSFLVAGLVFLIIGIVIFKASLEVHEVVVEYSPRKCSDQDSLCNVTFDIPSTMKKPVYMYYSLTNFYQNHRRYVKSRNDKQLKGEEYVSYSELDLDCSPKLDATSSSRCNPSDPKTCRNPCGLIAASRFNDSFNLYRSDALGETKIDWRKDGIAWSSDTFKFRNRKSCEVNGAFVYNADKGCTVDVEDEEFMVWMRASGVKNFRKLHRIIEQDLVAGQYTVYIHNVYPVLAFDGRKSVILSTTTWIGGKNDFLGIGYLSFGCLFIVIGIAFCIKQLVHPRKFADQRYLVFKREEHPAVHVHH